MKRPSKRFLDKFKADIKSDSVFRANTRLLQSIWREEKFKDKIGRHTARCLGSLLPKEIAVGKQANFLTKGIYETVVEEIRSKKGTGAVITEPRIWINLLSSQPLSFNLFGELKTEKHKDLATKLFRGLFPGLVKQVQDIKFEYSPGRDNKRYLGDGTAFDVFVEFTANDEGNGFVGIEVKYSEGVNKGVEGKGRYTEVAQNSRIFKEEHLRGLLSSNIRQIWRDHLLALSMLLVDDDTYQHGFFTFLYPKDNSQWSNAVRRYSKMFRVDDERCSKFYPITLECVVSVLKQNSDAKWIEEFENRYLNFRKIEELDRVE